MAAKSVEANEDEEKIDFAGEQLTKEFIMSASIKRSHSSQTVYSFESAPSPEDMYEEEAEYEASEMASGLMQELALKFRENLASASSSKQQNQSPSLAENCEFKPTSKFPKMKNVVGSSNAKYYIKERLINMIENPTQFDGETPNNLIIICGDPGCGKSMLSKSIATELQDKARYFKVSSETFMSPYIGESEKQFSALWQVCQKADKPCLLFMEEIDSFFMDRGTPGLKATTPIKNHLLATIEGVYTPENANLVIIVGTTNLPQNLDRAAIRRAQLLFATGPETDQDRCKVLVNELEDKYVKGINKSEMREIVKLIRDLSANDIARVVKNVKTRALSRANKGQRLFITGEDFEDEIAVFGIADVGDGEMKTMDDVKRRLKITDKKLPSTESAKKNEKFKKKDKKMFDLFSKFKMH